MFMEAYKKFKNNDIRNQEYIEKDEYDYQL